jgi:hypothetical protein
MLYNDRPHAFRQITSKSALRLIVHPGMDVFPAFVNFFAIVYAGNIPEAALSYCIGAFDS